MQTTTTHERFTHELPRMQRIAKFQFRHLSADRREEAVQNVLSLAWKAYFRLEELGRENEPNILNSVLSYSIRQTKAGRKIQGTNSKKAKDAMDYRDRGRLQFRSSECLDSLVSRNTPIPDAVSFRVDVPAFFATLKQRQQQIAHDFVAGMTTSEVAEKHKVTPSAISQFRLRFKKLYDEFFAE